MTDTENWSDVVFTGLVDEFVGRIGEVDTELPLTVFFRVVLCRHLQATRWKKLNLFYNAISLLHLFTEGKRRALKPGGSLQLDSRTTVHQFFLIWVFLTISKMRTRVVVIPSIV